MRVVLQWICLTYLQVYSAGKNWNLFPSGQVMHMCHVENCVASSFARRVKKCCDVGLLTLFSDFSSVECSVIANCPIVAIEAVLSWNGHLPSYQVWGKWVFWTAVGCCGLLREAVDSRFMCAWRNIVDPIQALVFCWAQNASQTGVYFHEIHKMGTLSYDVINHVDARSSFLLSNDGVRSRANAMWNTASWKIGGKKSTEPQKAERLKDIHHDYSVWQFLKLESNFFIVSCFSEGRMMEREGSSRRSISGDQTRVLLFLDHGSAMAAQRGLVRKPKRRGSKDTGMFVSFALRACVQWSCSWFPGHLVQFGALQWGGSHVPGFWIKNTTQTLSVSAQNAGSKKIPMSTFKDQIRHSQRWMLSNQEWPESAFVDMCEIPCWSPVSNHCCL